MNRRWNLYRFRRLVRDTLAEALNFSGHCTDFIGHSSWSAKIKTAKVSLNDECTTALARDSQEAVVELRGGELEEELMGEPDTPRKSERGNSRADSRLLKPRDSRENSKLLEHIYDSYNWLRIGMAVTAFAFPPLLWAWGKVLFGLPLQGSMSEYYWASPGGDPPVRVWFVGFIFAIGFFLFLYKGYSRLEELALDFAAIFLIGVALVPMCGSGVGQCSSWSFLHGLFAIVFFILIALVAISDSFSGLREAQDSTSQGRYRLLYLATGAGMIALPVVAFILHYFLGRADTATFWVELAGIYAFAFYWSTKTRELRKTVADRPDLDIDPQKRRRSGR